MIFSLPSDDDLRMIEAGNPWHNTLGRFAGKQDAHWKQGGAPLTRGLSLTHPPEGASDLDAMHLDPSWIDLNHFKPDMSTNARGQAPPDHSFGWAGSKMPTWLPNHISTHRYFNAKMLLPSDLESHMKKPFTDDRPPEHWIDLRGIHQPDIPGPGPHRVRTDPRVPFVGFMVHPGTSSVVHASTSLEQLQKHGDNLGGIFQNDVPWTVGHSFFSTGTIPAYLRAYGDDRHIDHRDDDRFPDVWEPDQRHSYIDNVPWRDVYRTMSALTRHKHEEDFSEHAQKFVPSETYQRARDHASGNFKNLQGLRSVALSDEDLRIDPRGGLITSIGQDLQHREVPVRYSFERQAWTHR